MLKIFLLTFFVFQFGIVSDNKCYSIMACIKKTYLNDHSRLLQPFHHSPSRTATFADADIVRQCHIGRKFQRKSQYLDFLVTHPFFVFQVLDMHLHGAFGIVAELVEQAHELVLEDLLQLEDAFRQAAQAGIGGVVVLIEGDPLADVVAEGFVPHAEGILFYVEAMDAHGSAAAVEREGPVGL